MLALAGRQEKAVGPAHGWDIESTMVTAGPVVAEA
jgi:hypothetical protein